MSQILEDLAESQRPVQRSDSLFASPFVHLLQDQLLQPFV